MKNKALNKCCISASTFKYFRQNNEIINEQSTYYSKCKRYRENYCGNFSQTYIGYTIRADVWGHIVTKWSLMGS